MATDSKKMVMISNIMAKLAAYQKCAERQCKNETKAHKQATESHRNKIEALREDFARGKIPFNVFTKEVNKVRTHMMDLQQTKDRNECALKKCKSELLKVLDVFIKGTTEECRTVPKACETSQAFQRFKTKLDNGGAVSHEDMKALMNMLVRR